MNPTPRAKPVQEIRLGVVRAAIWRNETENGPRYNTTFSRIYRDAEQWNNTDSFGREDLLLVAKVADLAHTWIHAQGRETTHDPATNSSAVGTGPGQARADGPPGVAGPGAPTAPTRHRGSRELPLQR